MADKKIIVVAGATGSQGGGLAHAILADKDGEFAVRALSRDTNSEKSKALAKAGAEIVSANMDDPESLKRAFAGAYGAYCVTFFWDHFSPEKERAHAGAMAKAAKEAGLQHVIWSTLEDTRKWVPLSDNRMPTLMGKYKVPHFDAKGEADRFFTELGVPVTLLWTSFYWDNFVGFGMGPKKSPAGNLVLSMPMADKKLAGIAAEDIGKCAYGIFKRRKDFIGKSVGIAGEHLTGLQMAAEMSRALGKGVEYKSIPFDVYRGLGFPGAADLGNMFQIYCDFESNFCAVRDVGFTRSVNPELQSFAAWLSKNSSRIPIE
jgi:uncharacterized protein YbjT (DUF2867 family)